MIKDFTDAHVPDQTGKTFLITGANTGIGFEAAAVLAGRGARVLLGCRSVEKGRQAVQRITAAHSGADVEVVELDLAHLDSVRRAAAEVAAESRLDGLVNNAGIMNTPRMATRDGFEAQFGVNHLGHFALTALLLENLEATPRSRIVVISSQGHRRGDIHFEDIHASDSYSPAKRYYQSKLANLLFMYELDRRLRSRGSDTIAVGAHPGGATTELMRHMPAIVQRLMPLAGGFLNSAAEGAWPTLAATTHPDVEGGQYFGPDGFYEMSGKARLVDSNDRSKDPQLAHRLWDLSIELTGIDPGI